MIRRKGFLRGTEKGMKWEKGRLQHIRMRISALKDLKNK